jgi:hypothetical protein
MMKINLLVDNITTPWSQLKCFNPDLEFAISSVYVYNVLVKNDFHSAILAIIDLEFGL